MAADALGGGRGGGGGGGGGAFGSGAVGSGAFGSGAFGSGAFGCGSSFGGAGSSGLGGGAGGGLFASSALAALGAGSGSGGGARGAAPPAASARDSFFTAAPALPVHRAGSPLSGIAFLCSARQAALGRGEGYILASSPTTGALEYTLLESHP
jgi:hypothetical protein